jgi:hypothetical protein
MNKLLYPFAMITVCALVGFVGLVAWGAILVGDIPAVVRAMAAALIVLALDFVLLWRWLAVRDG